MLRRPDSTVPKTSAASEDPSSTSALEEKDARSTKPLQEEIAAPHLVNQQISNDIAAIIETSHSFGISAEDATFDEAVERGTGSKDHLTPQTAQMEDKSAQADMPNDPYADLDPWGRASLNRFAAMLREEARAESNKDKLNIFNVFSSRESRLRVVLYGSDEDLIVGAHVPEKLGPEPRRAPSSKLQHLVKTGPAKRNIQRSNTTKTQAASKELPPLPPNRDSVVNPPFSKATSLQVDVPEAELTQQNGSEEESHSPKYSPGGRPIVQHRPQTSRDLEPSKTATIDVSQPSEAQGNEEPITDASADLASKAADDQGNEGIERPAYRKPKFNEDGSEVKNYLTNRRSIYRPFATQTMESMEHATNFGREPDFSLEQPPVPRIEDSSATPKADKFQGSSDTASSPPTVDLRRFIEADFDPLLMVLPESETVSDESTQLTKFKQALETVTEDFSFIHASVVSWDLKIKRQREENERHRHARQMDSEQRIDALFDDHEIGYGDIAELEGEFKQSEAAKKAEEDRSEYQLFIEDVFNIVWTRLHFELDQLKPHYEQYSKFMDGTLAGKDMFEIEKDGLALAPTMALFLNLHQKLEIRHQKAFEAVLERDRRLKKTEISPWYSLSNLTKVKQLEKQFEDAEKKAIIGYCQERNERANRLMDILDQNTLRGVGANQDYMEAVMKAVRRIASGRAYASTPGLDAPTQGIDLVEKAKIVTAVVASSSEQIVQTFHVADMLLNNADYEVSVAKAKVAKADLATMNKLKEERTKEDQKLMRDLEHRLALIREDRRRTNDEIVKLMLFLGVQNGRALNAQPAPAALGVQQEQQVTAGGKDG